MHIRTSRLNGLFLLAALAFWLLPPGQAYAVSSTRGEAAAVQIGNGYGGSISLYRGSYALLIGVSNTATGPNWKACPWS